MKTKLSVAAIATALTWATPADARVTKIVIDQKVSPAFCTGTPPVCPSYGDVGQYETLTGRAFGELDPHDSQNEEITDLKKAKRNKWGKVEYVATFHIVKPIDMSRSSGLMWHDVPNRGGRINISTDLRTQGDIGLSSAWQGDNAGATTWPPAADIWSPTPLATIRANEWVAVPVITGVTGRIFGRIINRSGLNAAPLNVMGNPIPYFPANVADNSGAVLTIRTKETIDGDFTEALQGDLAAAGRHLRRASELYGSDAGPLIEALLEALAGRGDRRAVAERLAAFPTPGYVEPGSGSVFGYYETPAVLVKLGEPALALDYLERHAAEESAAEWPLMVPALDPVRCEPRFVALIKKLNTADPHAARVCKS